MANEEKIRKISDMLGNKLGIEIRGALAPQSIPERVRTAETAEECVKRFLLSAERSAMRKSQSFL